MTTIASALAAATRLLSRTSDTARLDAELLMAHALAVSRSDLLLRHLHDPAPAAFDAMLARRVAHEPVAYITGHQEFWGLDLVVGPDVLIPRGDSETLIALAETRMCTAPPARVLDLGTGSGALLLAALTLWPGAQGIGIDRSGPALALAATNAVRTGLGTRAQMMAADWTSPGWADALGRFDLVLANPPYVETGAALMPDVAAHEPHGALFAGADGLDDYRVLIPQLPALIAPGGCALVEIGHTQGEAVVALGGLAGLIGSVHPDLGGRPRVVCFVAG
jgi:release factor glutamine methyltransferase